jgi:hypothetical protein
MQKDAFWSLLEQIRDWNGYHMLGAKVLDEIEDLIEDQSVGTLFPLVLGHLNLSYILSRA